jgi:hypothetical protein
VTFVRLGLGCVGIKLIRPLVGPRLHLIDLGSGIGLELRPLALCPAGDSLGLVLSDQAQIDLDLGLIDPLLELGPIVRCGPR